MPEESNKKKKLFIVSNRLPVSIGRTDEGLSYKASPGGLASALSSLESDKYEKLWIGWTGSEFDLDAKEIEKVKDDLKRDFGAMPIFLSRNQINRYYLGFSNKVLSPFFHYMPSQSEFQERDWDVYKEVNKVFADAVLNEIGDDIENSLIWIHDYQLMLVPQMIRQKFPKAKISFFLHIPFPSSELFQTIPHAEDLLRGLLGSSIVGFHTYGYLRHFRSSLLRILGINSDIKSVEIDSHICRLKAYPISVDTEKVHKAPDSPEGRQESSVLNKRYKNKKVLLGVERLDYTKGLLQKMIGFQRFLEQNPEYVGKVVLAQIAVPTRTKIESYRKFKEQVEDLVNEINEKYEDLGHEKVIHYMYKSLSFNRLSAYYKRADVCLVTPLRDGMNLVAKEYIAVKKDSGVLILSKMAGAASELGETLTVNPWSPHEIASTLETALNMSPSEQSDIMSILFNKISKNDIGYWSSSIISDLKSVVHDDSQVSGVKILTNNEKESIKDRYRNASKALIALDYDGTLVEFSERLRSVKPDRALLETLRKLKESKNTELAIVSGRSKDDLMYFFGKEATSKTIFSAEHGLWIRHPEGEDWKRTLLEDRPSWYEDTKSVMYRFFRDTPGSLIEEKEYSLVWHYRGADAEFGLLQSRELVAYLTDFLANQPAEVSTGKMSVEVRPHGIHKGNIYNHLMMNFGRSYDFILAIGDDFTDEDLFVHGPEGTVSVKVGKGSSKAKHRLRNVSEVRAFLNTLTK